MAVFVFFVFCVTTSMKKFGEGGGHWHDDFKLESVESQLYYYCAVGNAKYFEPRQFLQRICLRVA